MLSIRRELLQYLNSCKKGFTLVELIMIIVAVGITLPVILFPYFQSAREIKTPALVSGVTMVARGNMEIEFDNLCITTGPTLNWPSEDATNPGAYLKTIPTDKTTNVNGVPYISSAGNLGYATVIEGSFYQPDLATIVDNTPDGAFGGVIDTDDLYLVITVTTTVDGNGTSVSLTALKSKDYLKNKIRQGKCV